MSKRMMGNSMLLLGAMIWGAAFVAQTVGMEYVEPFTFQASRCLLGSLVLLPVIAVILLKKKDLPEEPGQKTYHTGRQTISADFQSALRSVPVHCLLPAAGWPALYHCR